MSKKRPPNNSVITQNTPNVWWLITFFLLAIATTATGIYVEDLNADSQLNLKILTAISIAGVASIIPGFFDIEITWLRNSVKAGGAIGIFVLIIFVTPDTLNDKFKPKINLSGSWNFFLQTADGEVPVGSANIEHIDGENIFNIIGNVEVNPDAPKGIYNTPLLTFESDFALITDKKVIFHYLTNDEEEGTAIADYTNTSAKELYFNFKDYDEKDKDGVPSGVLRFVLIELE